VRFGRNSGPDGIIWWRGVISHSRFPLFPTLRRMDNDTFANDTVHRLPVDVGPNHFEFERVISGQLPTGLRRQQLGLRCHTLLFGLARAGCRHSTSPQLAAYRPQVCTDPDGFDRTAFHRDFDASVVGFFRENLVSDGGTR
jgi:hypothetical protein